MLKKSLKIGRNSFNNLGKPVRTLRSGLFTIKVFGLKGDFNKFSVSISKKVQKKAVLRNKLRRITYDFLRKNEPNSVFGGNGGHAVQIIFNKMPEDPKNDIVESLRGILNRNS